MFESDFQLEIGSTREKLLFNITRLFSIVSDCNNVFDFKRTYDLMVEMFCVMGFEPLISDKVSGSVFSKLIEKKLITVEYSYYGTKKHFSLSDRYFDVILGMISIALPPIFCVKESSIKYSGNFGLKKLDNVIENYFNFFDNKDNFQETKFILFLKYPELATKLNNFHDVVIDFSCLDAESFEIKQSVFGMYYIKTRLNEYCFQTVAMSFFETYYTADYYTTKNMLFSPSNIEFNLY
jgi:hypothetical protein